VWNSNDETMDQMKSYFFYTPNLDTLDDAFVFVEVPYISIYIEDAMNAD
jgi:hypothetical protein